MYRVKVRRGMTLTELLVAIGVAVVLLSIFLGVAAHVRRSARSVQCLSNLRQLAGAYQLYVSHNDGHGPVYMHDLRPNDGKGFWILELRPLHGKIDDVRFCPEATDRTGGWGGAHVAWGPLEWTDQMAGSYGFNGWNHFVRESRGADITFSGGPPAAYVRFNSPQASQVPLFADAAWMDAWPRDRDPAPPNLTDGDVTHQNTPPDENMMARFCIARHGKSINIAYLDGHAATVPLADLWHQRWSNRFAPRDDIVLPGG